jgi:hypothetical protein
LHGKADYRDFLGDIERMAYKPIWSSGKKLPSFVTLRGRPPGAKPASRA